MENIFFLNCVVRGNIEKILKKFFKNADYLLQLKKIVGKLQKNVGESLGKIL